jgi:hypothetical protein
MGKKKPKRVEEPVVPEFDMESQNVSEMQNINQENIKKVSKAEIKKLEKEKKVKEREE